MSGPEQLLYLVVVPGAIVAIIWALASIGGPQSSKRYRPGRPYEFTPVWYLGNHRRRPSPGGAGRRRELTAGTAGTSGGAAVQGTTGGASDRW